MKSLFCTWIWNTCAYVTHFCYLSISWQIHGDFLFPSYCEYINHAHALARITIVGNSLLCWTNECMTGSYDTALSSFMGNLHIVAALCSTHGGSYWVLLFSRVLIGICSHFNSCCETMSSRQTGIPCSWNLDSMVD